MLWFFVPLALCSLLGVLMAIVGYKLDAKDPVSIWAFVLILVPVGALWGAAVGLLPSAIIFGVSVLAKIV